MTIACKIPPSRTTSIDLPRLAFSIPTSFAATYMNNPAMTNAINMARKNKAPKPAIIIPGCIFAPSNNGVPLRGFSVTLWNFISILCFFYCHDPEGVVFIGLSSSFRLLGYRMRGTFLKITFILSIYSNSKDFRSFPFHINRWQLYTTHLYIFFNNEIIIQKEEQLETAPGGPPHHRSGGMNPVIAALAFQYWRGEYLKIIFSF
ncbi:hypothetical protein PNA2_1730 [Pyrococcus sp. NA2]|nr:hypothetical protein PNA2_1730 [Pyrococcus sp. NA2]